MVTNSDKFSKLSIIHERAICLQNSHAESHLTYSNYAYYLHSMLFSTVDSFHKINHLQELEIFQLRVFILFHCEENNGDPPSQEI